MREKCEKILAHGINCFVNRQLIYNYPEEIFADAGACTPLLACCCQGLRLCKQSAYAAASASAGCCKLCYQPIITSLF